MTSVHDRIRQAAMEEIDAVGPTRLRLQSVASRAGVATSMVSIAFDGREGLIGAALSYEFESILQELLGSFVVGTDEEAAASGTLRRLLYDMTAPEALERQSALRERMASVVFWSRPNEQASREIGLVRLGLTESFLLRIGVFERSNQLAPGVSVVMFARIVFGVIYGQSFFTDQAEYEIDADDLTTALRRVVDAMLSSVDKY